MATINAAAAMHVSMRGVIAAFVLVAAGGLAACTSDGSGNLLDSNTNPLSVGSAPQAPVAAARGKIAIAPVIGAPDTIGKQIVAQLGAETSKSNIAVAQAPGEQVDYTLRGYIVAAREVSGIKVSYIWDVTNPTGARVHRITGEELVKGAGAGDPWASVSPDLVGVIVAKTGQQLNSWMPQKAAAPAVQPASLPIASAALASQVTSASPASGSSRIATAAIGAASPGAASTGAVTAIVPDVVGAPGDGSSSLASALRNELMRQDIKPAAPGAAAAAYRVEGRVKMGAANAGQQDIKIDWVVRDLAGASLGTVTQENKIPAGSLNGPWGSTASAAAAAASQGIIKLLPRKTALR